MGKGIGHSSIIKVALCSIISLLLIVLALFSFTKCSPSDFWGMGYYKLPNNTYLTVWKRYVHKEDYPIGDVVVIPGKYKGIVLPKDISYISASSISEVCLIYIKNNSDNTIYVDTTRCYKIEIKNNAKSSIRFQEYSDSMNNVNEHQKFTERIEVQLDIRYNQAFIRQPSFKIIKPSVF